MKLRVAILSAFVTLLVSVAPAVAQEIHDSVTRKILREFYDSTNGREWVCDSNWLSDKPLNQWHGINCYISERDSMVSFSMITLNNNNLSGTLPESLGQLTGTLGHAYIDLSDNKITGKIPRSLLNLQYPTNVLLDLHNNRIVDTLTRDDLRVRGNYNFLCNSISTPSPLNYNRMDFILTQLIFGIIGIAPLLGIMGVLAAVYYKMMKKRNYRRLGIWWLSVYIPLALIIGISAIFPDAFFITVYFSIYAVLQALTVLVVLIVNSLIKNSN